ncbi:TPA: hypothetical protein NVL54_001544 [Acinetobacter baumannii]|nr:hypothetical protein [Acinetobacter baumannii]HCK0214000.1 hypothetical protein [Acinetobacter baumannii]
MAEKLLANASSKLTLEEKAKMEWIAKLEGKNSLSNLIRSMCKKKISEVEGEMAGKSSLFRKQYSICRSAKRFSLGVYSYINSCCARY